MADFVMTLHTSSGQEVAKLLEPVKGVFFNRNANKTAEEIKWRALYHGSMWPNSDIWMGMQS